MCPQWRGSTVVSPYVLARINHTCFLLCSLTVQVWAALLEKMPMTAMIRNLGKMSAIGLLKPLSSHAALVCQKLGDENLLHR